MKQSIKCVCLDYSIRSFAAGENRPAPDSYKIIEEVPAASDLGKLGFQIDDTVAVRFSEVIQKGDLIVVEGGGNGCPLTYSLCLCAEDVPDAHELLEPSFVVDMRGMPHKGRRSEETLARYLARESTR
jgi:hypothetical protein